MATCEGGPYAEVTERTMGRGDSAWFFGVTAAVLGCGEAMAGSSADAGSGGVIDGASPVHRGGLDAGSPDPPATCPGDTLCDPDAGPCTPATVSVVAVGVTELAFGGNRVYWASTGSGVYAANGTVGYVDRCGIAESTLATEQGAPYNLAADEQGPCWTDLGSNVDGELLGNGDVSCFLGGGVTQPGGSQMGTWGLAVDGPRVFWADGVTGTGNGDVYSASRDGSDVPSHLAAGAFGAYPGLVLDATTVYVAGGGKLLSIDRNSGAVAVLAQGSLDGAAIAIDATSVYLLNTNRDLVAISKAGGAMTVLASGCTGGAIAADGRYAYCIAGTAVLRAAIGGGAAQTLAVGAGQYAIAADGVYVYVAMGATILRVPSP